MANSALQGLAYSDIFAALGRFIQDKNLSDVFVMEFEQGIIVTGASLVEGRTNFDHVVETFVLSAEDLRALVSNKSSKSEKRGLFGR